MRLIVFLINAVIEVHLPFVHKTTIGKGDLTIIEFRKRREFLKNFKFNIY